MSFIKDFKAFALKGNVIDLAVAVIIGGAFGKIVSAMVDDIIMPIISMITGKGGFTDKFMILGGDKDASAFKSLEEAKKAGANVFAYGHFVQTVVDFIIIALFIFLAIRMMSKMQKKEEAAPAAPPAPTPSENLLTEIRDLLKQDRRA
jgi:large conductance mechanosensitive channel